MTPSAISKMGGPSLCCWFSCLLFVTLACSLQPRSELLTVRGIEPEEVQLGEDFTLLGDGFALSRSATVLLQGRVYRAAADPREIELTLPAETESQDRLRLHLPATLQSTLCGPTEEAHHSTFRGTLQVAIASRERGAPPVVGTLHGAVLELYPEVTTQQADELSLTHGARVRSFFGIDLSESQHGGVVVVAVLPGGRADRAGLRAGDRIVQMDGVSVLQPSDLAPPPQRRAQLLVDRAGVRHSVEWSVDGFQHAPAGYISWVVGSLWAFAIGLALWGSAFSRRWVGLRAPSGVLDMPRGRGAGGAPWFSLSRNVLLWVAVVGAVTLSERWLVVGSGWPPLGGVVLLLFSSCVLVTRALLVAGRRRNGFALRRGLRGAGRQTVWLLLAGSAPIVAGNYALLEWSASLQEVGEIGLRLSPGVLLLLVVAVVCSVGTGQLQTCRLGPGSAIRRALDCGGAWSWLHVCASSCLMAWAVVAALGTAGVRGAIDFQWRWLALCTLALGMLLAWRAFVATSNGDLRLSGRLLMFVVALTLSHWGQREVAEPGLLVWLGQVAIPALALILVTVVAGAIWVRRNEPRPNPPSLWI